MSEFDRLQRVKRFDLAAAVAVALVRTEVQVDDFVTLDGDNLGPCWLWTGSCCGETKRPNICIRGVTYYLARVVLSVTPRRPLKRKVVAAHRCDNGRCIRPNHLEEATQSKNLTDARHRGRRPRLLAEEKEEPKCRRRKTS